MNTMPIHKETFELYIKLIMINESKILNDIEYMYV
jgi:hypothetical protein